METLLATYAVAWAVMSAYILWLASANSRLARRLEQLERQRGKQQTNKALRSKVA